MRIGCIGWWESSGVIATTHTSPLDSGLRRNDELGGDSALVGGSVLGHCHNPPRPSGATNWGAGYFPTNRSCRLVPAHRGMRIGCIGWWESSSVIATTRTSPLDSGLRRNDELGGRLHAILREPPISLGSCRLVPAHEYEKRELWFGKANWHGGFCHAPPPTPAGDKPPRYIFSFRPRPSVYNSARFAGGEPASRLIGGRIFVRMTSARGFQRTPA